MFRFIAFKFSASILAMSMLAISILTVMILMPATAYAAPPREIPYDFALSRALTRDTELIPLDRMVRQANVRARELLDEHLALVNIDRALADEVYGRRIMELAERDRLQREHDRRSFNIEMTLRSYLANIAEHEANLVMLEKNADFLETSLEQTRLRHELGMASDMDLREAEHQLEQVRLNYEMLSLTLENQRHQLNRLIHHPITANIQIVYEIEELEPLLQLSDREIQRLVDRDHNLLYWRETVAIRRHEWQRRVENPDVDIRILEMRLEAATADNNLVAAAAAQFELQRRRENPDMDREHYRLQHRLAVIERDMAERQAELNVRNSLAEWERLVEEEIAITADLNQAISDYEDMKIRLEAGLVTQLQVNAMQLAVAAQEARLVRHGYDFWIAGLRVGQPYLR